MIKQLQEKKGKRSKKEKEREIDSIFESKISKEESISEEHKKFVFKLIYDAVHKTQNQQISLNDLWGKIQSHRNNKYCNSKSELLDVILSLDDDGKVLYSDETKDY